MKQLLTILLFAVSIVATSQNFTTDFRNDLCECFTQMERNDSNIDECFELSASKYEDEIEKMIDPNSNITPYEQGVVIGQDLFFTSQEFLVANCDAYYEYFNLLREDSILEMKEAFDQNIVTNLTLKISEEPTADLLWSRGNMYFAISAYDRALADFEEAIALDPAYAQANFSKAWILERQGNYADAISLYEEAMNVTGIREMSVFIALARRNAIENKK